MASNDVSAASSMMAEEAPAHAPTGSQSEEAYYPEAPTEREHTFPASAASSSSAAAYDQHQPAQSFAASVEDSLARDADGLGPEGSPSDHVVVSPHTSPDPHAAPGSSISMCCSRLGTRLRSHLHRYMVAFFLVFAVSNLVIGASGYDEETCSDLAIYCLGIGGLCCVALLGTCQHYRHKETWADRRTTFFRSALGRIVLFLVTLFGLVVVVASCASLAQLAEDSCPYHRSVRQIALADIVIFLTSGFALGMYYFLRYHFPELRYSAITKQAGKTALLCLCLGAVVSCLVNLITHPYSGRTVYHYGFTARPERCLTDCGLLEEQGWTLERYNQTRRRIACFDSDGDQMPDTTPCDWTVPDQRPPSDHLALAACPMVNCTRDPTLTPEQAASNPWRSAWILIGDLTWVWGFGSGGGGSGGQDSVDTVLGGSIGSECVRSDTTDNFHYTLLCRRNRWSAGAVADSDFQHYCSDAPLPAMFFGQPYTESLQRAIPRRRQASRKLMLRVGFDVYASCPKRCLQLFVSAILFASIFGVFSILLTVSLLCARVRRPHHRVPARSDYNVVAGGTADGANGGGGGGTSPLGASSSSSVGGSAVVVVESTSHSVSSAIIHSAVAEPAPGAPHQGEVVVLPALDLAPSPPPPEDAPLDQQMSHASTQLKRIGRAVALLMRHLLAALRILTLHGTRGVRPYWKHLLLLVLCCLLVGMSIFSFLNLLHLVNSNCRDYLVSCITTTVVTFLLTMVTLHAVIVNKDEMLQPERNPFETINLLQQESDDDEADEFAAIPPVQEMTQRRTPAPITE